MLPRHWVVQATRKHLVTFARHTLRKQLTLVAGAVGVHGLESWKGFVLRKSCIRTSPTLQVVHWDWYAVFVWCVRLPNHPGRLKQPVVFADRRKPGLLFRCCPRHRLTHGRRAGNFLARNLVCRGTARPPNRTRLAEAAA